MNKSNWFRLSSVLGAALILGCPPAGLAQPAAEVPPTAPRPESIPAAGKAKDVVLDGQTAVASPEAVPPTTAIEKSLFALSNADLGLDILAQSSSVQNTAISPFSLANALGLAQLAGVGKTAREIDGLFQPMTLRGSLLPSRMKEINTELTQQGSMVRSANRVWLSKGLAASVQPGYAALAQSNFLSDAASTPFERPEVAAAEINEWTRSKTEGAIPQLLQPQQLGGNAQFVLSNAIHFKGRWATPFDTARTALKDFRPDTGAAVATPTMHGTVRGRYVEVQGVQLIELPFQLNSKKLAEVVLQIALPPAGVTMDTFQSRATAVAWQGWAGRLSPEQIDISLPKLRMPGTTTALKPALIKLGLETIFNQRADLSRLSGHKGLMLDDIYQAVSVEWDEVGAEASAATAAVGVSKSLNFPVSVEVNRPFLFSILHVPSQTVLFQGRFARPI